jgi:hypothetical protein
MSLKKFINNLALLTLFFVAVSCEKPAGPGGRATIKGRVFATDWDNTQRTKLSSGYAAGERVYIIYGNTTEIGDDTRTGLDGSFEFRYLTKGHYKIFVNSLDTTIIAKGNDTENPVLKEVDIKGTREVVDVGVIKINR